MKGDDMLTVLTRYLERAQSRAMTSDEAKATARPVSRAEVVKSIDAYIDERVEKVLQRQQQRGNP